MINYNKFRNGASFTQEEIAAAEAKYNQMSTVKTNKQEVKTMKLSQTAIASVKTFASKGMTVDFAAKTINGRKLRNYVIVEQVSKKSAQTDVLNTSQVINLVAKALTGKSEVQAKAFVFKVLEQILFVEDLEYGSATRLSSLKTDIQIANENRAYIMTPKCVPASITEGTISRIVAKYDFAVCPDKKAEKSVLIGAGANAAGVYRNGSTLTSVNPIADVTKGLNRCNAGFVAKADNARRVVADLVYNTSEGQFVKEGIAHKALFVPGLAVFAQGIIGLNEETSFSFSAKKDFVRKFAIESIGSEIKTIEFETVVKYGDEIKVNDIVIYKHVDNTVLEISSVVPSLDQFETVWTFNIEATMVADNKANFKARDFGFKGMTHRNGIKVKESNTWEAIYSSECVKTSEALLTMFCQANPGHQFTVDGKLVNAKGAIVTSKQINAWYKANGQYFTVSTPICPSNKKDIQKAVGNAVTFETVDGVLYASQRVFGIETESLFNIELSSADEIAGWVASDVTGVAIQSMISKRVAKAVTKNAIKAKYVFVNVAKEAAKVTPAPIQEEVVVNKPEEEAVEVSYESEIDYDYSEELEYQNQISESQVVLNDTSDC